MSRLVWVGIGAAGGIMAYRHSQRVWERTKERGVAGNTAAVTRTAAAVYRGIRDAERLGVVDLTEQATTARILGADGAPISQPAAAAPTGTQPTTAQTTRKAASRSVDAARFLYTQRRQGH